MLKPLGLEVIRQRRAFDPRAREEGLDWPDEAETMVGLQRLENLQQCIKSVIHDEIPGDLIETGVWRGGAAIFMRAALEAYGDGARLVWAADSFEGLPRPDPREHPDDAEDALWKIGYLAVSLDEVKNNFAKYGFLDDRVRFLKGWFQDTLPGAPMESLAILRLDGDMYESTMVAFESLYPKLSSGGYVIVDDYDAARGCHRATDTYRARENITTEMIRIDPTAVYWRKE